jgi:hypothetical protein
VEKGGDNSGQGLGVLPFARWPHHPDLIVGSMTAFADLLLQGRSTVPPTFSRLSGRLHVEAVAGRLRRRCWGHSVIGLSVVQVCVRLRCQPSFEMTFIPTSAQHGCQTPTNSV